MFRLLFLLLLIGLGVVVYGWYSAQSLPDWYETGSNQQTQKSKVVDNIIEDIEDQGVGNYLTSKAGNLLKGELVLSENEFNALLQTSLQSSRDGLRLLQVSDGVNAQINKGQLEIGAVINLDKVARQDAETRERVKQVTDTLPLLNNSQIYVAVRGKPIAKEGGLAVEKDISIKLGSISLSKDFLEQFGVSLDDISNKVLPLDNLTIRSISLQDEQVRMKVLPRF